MINFFHIACLVSGYLLTIGIGCIIDDDWTTFIALTTGVVAFSIGWLIVPRPSLKVNFYTSNNIKRYKLNVLIVIYGMVLIYVAARYGLPLLSQDPTRSRLLQRHYFIAMGILYVVVPLIAATAYILYKEYRLSKYKYYLVLALLLFGTSMLAVRYIFLESVLVLVILSLYSNKFIKWSRGLFVISIFVLIFFASIQAIRSNDYGYNWLVNKLIDRAFIVNYRIFRVSSFGYFNLPSSTYENSLNKLEKNGGYNIGFILYNKIEGDIGTQGYAPISIIGEAYLNYGVGIISFLFLFLFGFLFRFIYEVFLLLFSDQYAVIFSAYYGMEMFRTSAHSLLGALIAVFTFGVFLLLVDNVHLITKGNKFSRLKYV